MARGKLPTFERRSSDGRLLGYQVKIRTVGYGGLNIDPSTAQSLWAQQNFAQAAQQAVQPAVSHVEENAASWAESAATAAAQAAGYLTEAAAGVIDVVAGMVIPNEGVNVQEQQDLKAYQVSYQ